MSVQRLKPVSVLSQGCRETHWHRCGLSAAIFRNASRNRGHCYPKVINCQHEMVEKQRVTADAGNLEEQMQAIKRELSAIAIRRQALQSKLLKLRHAKNQVS